MMRFFMVISQNLNFKVPLLSAKTLLVHTQLLKHREQAVAMGVSVLARM